MDNLSIRQGWRLAEMRGGLEFLAKKQFTGYAEYEMKGENLLRCLREVDTGSFDLPQKDSCARLGFILERIERWIRQPEVPIKIHFKGGYAKKIEL